MLKITIKSVVFSLFLYIFSCKKVELTATDYLEKGFKSAKKGSFETCIYNLSKIDEKFPFSGESKQATPVLIYCNYMQGNFANVHSMSENFESLYPTSPQNAYLTYLRALSYYRVFRNYRKSQDNLNYLILATQKLSEIAPNSVYTENLAKLIPHIHLLQNQNELYSAQHYLQTKNYISAGARLANLHHNTDDNTTKAEIQGYMEGVLKNLGANF